MKFFSISLIVIILTLGFNLSGQLIKIKAGTPICNIDTDAIYLDRYVLEPSEDGLATVNTICKAMGVNPSTFSLQSASIKKVEALILDGKRTIHYSPDYFIDIKIKTQSEWAKKYALAHEIGHHFNGHLLPDIQSVDDLNQRQKEELDADKFAGCALRRLGATEEDIQKAIMFLKEEGSKTHPPRRARSLYAIKGWDDCQPISDCEKKNTGNLTFLNKTQSVIEIRATEDIGIWVNQQTPVINILPNDTGSFINLKAGRMRLIVNKKNQYGFYTNYKDFEQNVKQCAENPPPIEIR